jgi:hypothetical protein
MNQFRHAIAIVVLLAACSGAADPLPRQVIVGDFGGPTAGASRTVNHAAMIHADTQSASVDLGCELIQIGAPLLTDDRGNFVLTGRGRRIGGPPPGQDTGPVRVNGHASDANGGTIDLLIQPITEQGAPVGESTSVIAVRNQQANLVRCP